VVAIVAKQSPASAPTDASSVAKAIVRMDVATLAEAIARTAVEPPHKRAALNQPAAPQIKPRLKELGSRQEQARRGARQPPTGERPCLYPTQRARSL
jgi:hypothetical protein